jgi:mannosyltransferase OCH1-like enzyme
MSEFIEIPAYIKTTLDNTTPPYQVIPKTIIQTYKTNKIHPYLYKNIMEIRKRNPDYDYRLITDSEGIFLIKNYFQERVLKAFEKIIIGAAKGDFIRYIVLFLYGGVYLDLDASIELDLNTFINPIDEFIFFINGDANLEQFCFMVKPKHPLILKIIEEMVTRIENKEPNIFKATGPTLFNDVIYNTMNKTNIYDTNKNVSNEERAVVYSNNNRFMGGKIVLRHGNDMENKFIFRIEDSENMLYDNKETIRYCHYDPSTNVNYIYTLF